MIGGFFDLKIFYLCFYEDLPWQGSKNHNVKAYIDLTEVEKDAIALEEQNISMLKKSCPLN